ncbi:MAG: transposase, partial [Candidatus Sulfotelmatobacter sp.]
MLIHSPPKTHSLELAALALQNKKVIYGLLLRASAETLLEVARNPRHLGAEIGFFSVLHTWNQKVQLHPHVHCVVPAGGLSRDQLAHTPHGRRAAERLAEVCLRYTRTSSSCPRQGSLRRSTPLCADAPPATPPPLTTPDNFYKPLL